MTDYPTTNRDSGRSKTLRLIVLHSTETPADTARAVAVAFQNPARRASAHWIIGTDATLSGVPEEDTAWAAPGANADGIQIEQCGYAYSTDWTSGDGLTVLRATASVVAGIHTRHGIPLVHLTDAQLAAGASGIVTHAQVSAVYKMSDHTDPGPSYPIDQLIALASAGTTTTTPTTTTAETSEEDETVYTIIKSPNRVHALIAPGLYKPFSTSEQLKVALAVLKPAVRDNINDRQYDVARALIVQGTLDATKTAKALADIEAALKEDQ